MRILGSIHIVVAVLLLATGVGLYVDHTSEHLSEQKLNVKLGLERMVRLNQSLTSSVAMAVLEKNTLRAASYHSIRTELEATVREVQSLTTHMLLASDMLVLAEEQAALRAIESEVFALMRDERWPAAYQLLLGGEYAMSLKLYEINSDTAVGALAIELADIGRKQDRLRDLTLALRLGAVLLLLWTGWRYSNRLKAELAEQNRLRAAVTAANEALEGKVKQRTLELEAVNHQLEALSGTDGLTGLSNRRRFDVYWHEEWQRALRTAAPLAVIMIDVDHFKAYNDHYGHQQGDECLRRVSEALRINVRRAGELVARYGGEEFVVVMPGASAEQALQMAEAVRMTIQDAAIAHATSPVAPVLTVSLGLAVSYPQSTDTSEQLLHAADVALYDAKRQGRNRVVMAPAATVAATEIVTESALLPVTSSAGVPLAGRTDAEPN